MALRIFDRDLEMELPGAPVEIAVHQPGCVLQVGVAHGLDPQGKRVRTACQLRGENSGRGGGDPVERGIGGEIVELEKRHAVNRNGDRPGTGSRERRRGEENGNANLRGPWAPMP